MAKVGERIGAVMKAKEGVVHLFGYGVRIEDKVPPANAGGFGSLLHEAGAPNPCLRLDNGVEVFGCECWWGDEESVKKRFANHTVVQASISEIRQEVRNNG
ncbi:hypothetical protein [Halomonas sp. BMC6]|uniref:hypothetical protein n=1 Tax=Halomonas sp. BMC6 TaxID=3073244 RepID=UPI0030D01EFC